MSRWVLLRGLAREQRHWGRFPEQLRAALPGAEVLTLDLPGNGERWRERSPVHVAGMVAACREAVRARGWQGPVQVLALSLGGMVAVEWRARFAGEVAACVLINTSMRPFSRFHERLRWHNYPAILRQLALGDARSGEALVLRLTSERHGADAGLAQRWLAWQREYPVARINVLRQLAAAARYAAPDGAGQGGRVLVLAGARDRLVAPCCSRRLAQAWSAQLRIHPDAGHDLPLDDGPWVAAQVQEWLPSVGRSSAQR